jgi:colanic acid/amylovoran biosynthesis glycosyltransferase
MAAHSFDQCDKRLASAQMAASTSAAHQDAAGLRSRTGEREYDRGWKDQTALRSEMRADARETVLVYRDRIVPRSEANFLRREYVGFEFLAPVWVGCRIDDGVGDLGVQPLILGRSGAWGALDRALFKQFGRLPPRPDLKALRPRVVHAHFGRGGALALPIARALNVPLVVTFHGGDATKEKHYRRRLLPTIYQRRLATLQREASMIICVSDHIRARLIERGFPSDKLRVIRYGVDISQLGSSAPSPGQPYVLFVGRFVEKKGVDHLLEAMRLLRSQGADVPLVLIGDGPLAEDLKEKARLIGNVNFLGWLPSDDVRRWMRGALAVCVPSVTALSGDEEGLPNVVIEAMAECAPVIASRHGGIAEAIDHERTGLLVPPGDARAIAEAIKRLVGDPETRHSMGEMARHRAGECFSAVAQSRLLENELLSVSRSHGFSGSPKV